MQMRFLSKSSKGPTTPFHPQASDEPTIAHSARRLSPPGKPNIALAGILLGVPVMIVAFIALLSAGYPILEALLVAYSLQVVVFCVVIVMGLTGAKASEGGIPTPTDAFYRPREAVDTWRAYPSSVETENPVRIALVAPNTKHSRMIATDLARMGMEVHHSTDQNALLETVEAGPSDWGAVMFDLDSRSDVEAGVDEVLDFRAVCPEVPVQFLSGAALHRDLSQRRQSIADMTLHKPVLRRHLVASLDAMKVPFVEGPRDNAERPAGSVADITTS